MAEEIIQGVKNVAKFLGIHRDTIHRHMKVNDFPTPISAMSMGEGDEKKVIRIWRKTDVEEWDKNRKRKKSS